jgi:hypothetical protein
MLKNEETVLTEDLRSSKAVVFNMGYAYPSPYPPLEMRGDILGDVRKHLRV